MQSSSSKMLCSYHHVQVLILLPFRSTAMQTVKRLLQLAQRETRVDSVQQKARFLEEFGDEDGSVGAENGEPEAKQQQRTPAEHTVLFSGNNDDYFRLGIKLTKQATATLRPID